MPLRLCLTLAAAAGLGAATAESPPSVPPAVNPTSVASKLPPEERWPFDPRRREDFLVDPETRIGLENQINLKKVVKGQGPTTDPRGIQPKTSEQWLAYAKAQNQRVEEMIVNHSWSDAIKAADVALAILNKHQDDEAIRKEILRLKGYRTQAEDAQMLEEAQAQFDALDLRVEGILWSPEGSLALISGETRARGVNEHVKDCTILNIDTNRVDFLFIVRRRRFEFQRFVGEEAKAGKESR